MNNLGKSKHTGYTVFENLDKELVQKIKDIKKSASIEIGDVLDHWRVRECKVVSFINEKELLVYSDKLKCHDVYQIEDEDSSNNHLQKINDTFNVEDYYLENFGELAYGNMFVSNVKNIIPNSNGSFNSVETSLNTIMADIRKSADYEFKVIECYKSLSMFFNEDGNYVNRDYNFDLAKFEKCTKKDFLQNRIDDFLSGIDEYIPQKLYSIKDDVWFSDKFAYICDFNFPDSEDEIFNEYSIYIEIKPNQGNDKYYKTGESFNTTKLSKKCKKNVVDKKLFISMLRKKLENNLL